MIMVPQKSSDNSEGATGQLGTMKNAIFSCFQNNKETICLVWNRMISVLNPGLVKFKDGVSKLKLMVWLLCVV